jgi:HEAT repeat protein
MILDYTRNHRLFRFERYMKTVDKKSFHEIPALIEALGYNDYRFYEPASWALVRMMPAARKHANEVVPLLVSHLDSCRYNAKTLQTTILAVSSFGPDAAEAVPALMEQLKCQYTNTYEVSPDIIRFQAARALGEIGPAARDAVPALTEALNDPSPAVGDASRRALRQIEQGTVADGKKGRQAPGWLTLPAR